MIYGNLRKVNVMRRRLRKRLLKLSLTNSVNLWLDWGFYNHVLK